MAAVIKATRKKKKLNLENRKKAARENLGDLQVSTVVVTRCVSLPGVPLYAQVEMGRRESYNSHAWDGIPVQGSIRLHDHTEVDEAEWQNPCARSFFRFQKPVKGW